MSRLTSVATLALTALVAAACGGASGIVEVTPRNALAFEPSVTAFHDGFAVAWYDTRSGHGEIHEQPVDVDGSVTQPAVQLTTGTRDALEADVHAVEGVPGGDAFVVAWYERGADNDYTARLGLWSRHGAARWITTLSPRGRNTVARVHGDLVFVAWIEDEVAPAAGVWSGWWNLKGDAVVTPRRIADAGKTTYNLNASLVTAPSSGVPTAIVAFDALLGTRAQEVFLVEDDGARARVTRVTPDDGFASAYPDLALSGSRAALIWFDEKDGNQEVYQRVGPLADLVRPDAPGGRRVTSTKGHSIGAYTAWSGDRVGLAWCDDTPGQHEVYFAEFNAAGEPRGETRRVTHTRADSLIPAIQGRRGGWVVTWIEYEGTGHGQGRSQVLLTLIP